VEILERGGIIVLGIIFLTIFSFFIYNSFVSENLLLSKTDEKNKFKIEKLNACEKFVKLLGGIKKENNIYYVDNKVELKTLIEEILDNYPPCSNCKDNQQHIFFKLDGNYLILSFDMNVILNKKKGEYCIVLIKDKSFNDNFKLQLSLISKEGLNLDDFLENLKCDIDIYNDKSTLSQTSYSTFCENCNDLLEKIKEGNVLINFVSNNKLKLFYDKENGKFYILQPAFAFFMKNRNKYDLLAFEPSKEILNNVKAVVFLNINSKWIYLEDNLEDSLKQINNFQIKVVSSDFIKPFYNYNKENLENLLKEICKVKEKREPCTIEKNGGNLDYDYPLLYTSFFPLKYKLDEKKLYLGYFIEENSNLPVKVFENVIILFKKVKENDKTKQLDITFDIPNFISFNCDIYKIKSYYLNDLDNLKVIFLDLDKENLNLNPELDFKNLLDNFQQIDLRVLNEDVFSQSYLPTYYVKKDNKKIWNLLVFYLTFDEIEKLYKQGKFIVLKNGKELNIDDLTKKETENDVIEIKLKSLRYEDGKVVIEII
jgi:hypothetical protein